MENNLFNNSKILVVEDENSIAEGLMFNLSEEGYFPIRAKDGKEALELFKDENIDLIILDIMIPFIDGYEVAQMVRELSPQMPILMLSAKNSIEDKIRGLEIGVDDYITKPFHLEELLIRIKNMLIRKQWYQDMGNIETVYKFGENEINLDNFTCQSGQKTFKLTQKEAMVMKYLIENKGKIISRNELLNKVWNITSSIKTRTVDNFIARLRKYFESDDSKSKFIKSVRGAGYIFNDEDE